MQTLIDDLLDLAAGKTHLFEEFYRAPNAKVLEKEGTELGLTITRDLIAHYDGRNTVKSQAGQGTTFTVIWPTMRDA